jgi:hypothetical protein
MSEETASALEALRDEAGRLTWGLYRYFAEKA